MLVYRPMEQNVHRRWESEGENTGGYYMWKIVSYLNCWCLERKESLLQITHLSFLVFVFKITRNSNATKHIYRIFMYALCNFGQNYQTPINAAVSYTAI